MNRKGVHVLKWDGHLENLNGLFQRLYRENNLVDVTIACREGSIKAHKLVLSACSPFFERVLLENPCKHPVLIMRGVLLKDMQKLTAFMYKGLLEVQQEDLNSLLKTGEDLEIRGIAEIKRKRKSDATEINRNNDEDMNPNRRDTRYKGKKRVAVDHSPMRDSSSSPELLRMDPVVMHPRPKLVHQKSFSEEMPRRIEEPVKTFFVDPQQVVKEESQVQVDANTKSVQEEAMSTSDSSPAKADDGEKSISEEDPNNLLVTAKTLLPCSICCKPFETEESLQLHILHIHTKKYRCDMCSISFNRSSHLERHRRTHTGERPFRCNLCERDFSRQDKLRQHLRNSHCESLGGVGGGASEEGGAMLESSDVELESANWEMAVESDGKKRRGRPRKYPPKVVDPFAEKRRRGRPRKMVSEGDPLAHRGRSRENYDITSLPYGDFSYLMMPHHDADFSIVEPVVEIVSEQPQQQQRELQQQQQRELQQQQQLSQQPVVVPPAAVAPDPAPPGGVSVSGAAPPAAENSLVDSVRQIGECTIRAVPPSLPCTLIV